MTTSGGAALLTDDAEAAQCVCYLTSLARQPLVHCAATWATTTQCLTCWSRWDAPSCRDCQGCSNERRRQLRLRYHGPFQAVPGMTVLHTKDALRLVPPARRVACESHPHNDMPPRSSS